MEVAQLARAEDGAKGGREGAEVELCVCWRVVSQRVCEWLQKTERPYLCTTGTRGWRGR